MVALLRTAAVETPNINPTIALSLSRDESLLFRELAYRFGFVWWQLMDLSSGFEQSVHGSDESIERRLHELSLLVIREPPFGISPPPEALLTEDVGRRREFARTAFALDQQPDALSRSTDPCRDFGWGNKVIGDDPVDPQTKSLQAPNGGYDSRWKGLALPIE